jgi:hypothetical protein
MLQNYPKYSKKLKCSKGIKKPLQKLLFQELLDFLSVIEPTVLWIQNMGTHMITFFCFFFCSRTFFHPPHFWPNVSLPSILSHHTASRKLTKKVSQA